MDVMEEADQEVLNQVSLNKVHMQIDSYLSMQNQKDTLNRGWQLNATPNINYNLM